jgi:hypothetical protein
VGRRADGRRTGRGIQGTLPICSAALGCTGKPDPEPCADASQLACKSKRPARISLWHSEAIRVAIYRQYRNQLLERASREEDEDYQDFTPKRASNRNVYPG